MLDVELHESFKVSLCSGCTYHLTENGLWNETEQERSPEVLSMILTGNIKIIRQILTDKERRYLSSVILPYRNIVVYLRKKYICDSECIELIYRHNDMLHRFSLPLFTKGTMYRGMELEHEYSPDELGL